MPVTIIQLAVAIVVIAAGALVQGSIGIGLGILTVPILSLIDPVMAPVPTLLLAIPLAISMAWRERTDIHGRSVTWLLLGRFPGAVFGLGLLAVATQRTLDILIAMSVLAAVAILSTGVKMPRNRTTELITGITAGIMGMVASMGGAAGGAAVQGRAGPDDKVNTRAVLLVWARGHVAGSHPGRPHHGKRRSSRGAALPRSCHRLHSQLAAAGTSRCDGAAAGHPHHLIDCGGRSAGTSNRRLEAQPACPPDRVEVWRSHSRG